MAAKYEPQENEMPEQVNEPIAARSEEHTSELQSP